MSQLTLGGAPLHVTADTGRGSTPFTAETGRGIHMYMHPHLYAHSTFNNNFWHPTHTQCTVIMHC